MTFRDLIRLVGANLNRMRGRVAMTMMGVVIGTSAIVILISLASGLQESTVGNFEQFGSLNQITVVTRAQFGGEASDAEALTPDVIDDLKAMDGVVAVTPQERLGGQTTLKLNRLTGGASIYGIDPTVIPDMDFQMAEGSDSLGANTVIVGSGVGSVFSEGGGGFQGGPGFFVGPGGGPESEATAEDSETVDLYGQTLQLELGRFSDDGERETRTVRLFVGGVLEETGGNADYNVYMSLRDLEGLQTWVQGERPNYNLDGYSQVLVIAEQDPQVTLDVTEQINNMGFFSLSTTSIVESLNSFFLVIQAVLGGIASIALLVAAIGIANTMIMSVLERTREIGLMKAVGARNRDVMAVFIAEAGTIGLLGGIVGVGVGIGIAQIVGAVVNNLTASADASATLTVVTPLWLPFFSIAFAMLIGLLAGIYPAFRAVQLDPVQALRYE